MRRPASDGPGAGADLEQAEVVVVGRTLRLEEDGPAGDLRRRAEPEDVAVERGAALDVADVEDGVVEALDGHGGLLLSMSGLFSTKCMKAQVFRLRVRPPGD